MKLCSLFGEFNPHLLKQVKKILLPIDHIQTSACLELQHYYLLEKVLYIKFLNARKKKQLKKTHPQKPIATTTKPFHTMLQAKHLFLVCYLPTWIS